MKKILIECKEFKIKNGISYLRNEKLTIKLNNYNYKQTTNKIKSS